MKTVMRYGLRLALLAVAVQTILAPAAYADNCFFGRRVCHAPIVQSHVVHAAPVVKTVIQKEVIAAPDVYVVQNNNPAPLVAQGSSTYRSVGYQAAALPFFDPNSYFEQELQLHKAADATAAIRSERTAALVERVVALQAPAVERLAAGQAAQMVLKAAGLDPAHNSGGGALGVVISRNEQGQVTVTQLDPAKAAAYGSSTTITSRTQAAPAVDSRRITTSGSYPMITQFCASCHGTNRGTPPSGGFYIGDSEAVANVMKAEWFKITSRVSDGSMPPASSPQPSQDQRAKLLNEIEQIIRNRAN